MWTMPVNSPALRERLPLTIPLSVYFEMPQAPAQQFQVEIKAVFNRWWEESDMDAEDLSKAALTAIDDWLDEEIVGFEPES